MHTCSASKIATNAERRAFTITQFLQAYAISRTTTYAEIKAGRLVARRAGGRTLIARDDADAWFAALPRLHTADAP